MMRRLNGNCKISHERSRLNKNVTIASDKLIIKSAPRPGATYPTIRPHNTGTHTRSNNSQWDKYMPNVHLLIVTNILDQRAFGGYNSPNIFCITVKIRIDIITPLMLTLLFTASTWSFHDSEGCIVNSNNGIQTILKNINAVIHQP